MTTRRVLLQLAGGGAVGALFTPAPWRLITDAALWSQNWPGVPRPARGEIRAKFTNCALCEAGCAVRARCVGEQPIALAGARGGLCPYGLAGHHLPYHPSRVKQGPAAEAAAAVAAAVAKCGPEDRVAVLDLRPGRTASWTYRRAMAAVRNGVYIASEEPAASVNLANAKTVLSIGAPLLDGWGTPASVFAARPNFKLIQAEAVESRSASLADEWLAIRPGSEDALLHGVASALQPGAYPISRAAEACGIPAERITGIARQLKENGPAVVVDRRMSPAAVALNVMLGNWGATLGPRREAPVPDAWTKAAPATRLASLPDGSVRVLMIDESAPGEYVAWSEVKRKLAADAVVVAFAWSKIGYGKYAQYVLPTAVYPEVTDDLPPAIDSTAAAFRMAVPLVPAPEGMVNPAQFIAEAAGIPAGEALKERADAIRKTGRGSLVAIADGAATPARDVKADEFWTRLQAGDWWVEESGVKEAPPEYAWSEPAAPAADADFPLTVSMADERGAGALISPIMTKVYQESGVRLAPNRIVLHPDTARACGVQDGARAILETRCGKCAVEVAVDSSVAPGVAQAADRPGILDACGGSSRAKVVRA